MRDMNFNANGQHRDTILRNHDHRRDGDWRETRGDWAPVRAVRHDHPQYYHDVHHRQAPYHVPRQPTLAEHWSPPRPLKRIKVRITTYNSLLTRRS